MELKWLEDVIALAEADTLSAAARRRNISQPAFSRRIQSIEAWLGTEIVDRTSRPPRLTPAMLHQIEEIRAIIASIKQLRVAAQAGSNADSVVTIAAQQSVATGFLPEILGDYIARNGQAFFNLQPSNREECVAKLIARRASILVSYETARCPVGAGEPLIEKIAVSSDAMIAVCTPQIAVGVRTGSTRLPIITYPPDIFFGVILAKNILPALARLTDVQILCETSLVSGATELALAGAGVAWIPARLARSYLESGRLISPRLPSVPLTVVAARLRIPHNSAVQRFWQELSATDPARCEAEPIDEIRTPVR